MLRAILEDRDAAELTASHEKWTRDVARVEAELANPGHATGQRGLSEEDRAQLTDHAMERAAAGTTWRSCVTGSPGNWGLARAAPRSRRRCG
ncbi:hypothetical protein QJS66_00500 [Kocuria rhizophila]|nr:hypothetical protein QJS66_00500 [Kocuria rhizophila]